MQLCKLVYAWFDDISFPVNLNDVYVFFTNNNIIEKVLQIQQ